jgi:hypothetical protein
VLGARVFLPSSSASKVHQRYTTFEITPGKSEVIKRLCTTDATRKKGSGGGVVLQLAGRLKVPAGAVWRPEGYTMDLQQEGRAVSRREGFQRGPATWLLTAPRGLGTVRDNWPRADATPAEPSVGLCGVR